MQLFCYCNPASRDVLVKHLGTQQVCWVVRQKHQELLAVCRKQFKSDDSTTVMLAVASRRSAEDDLLELIDADTLNQTQKGDSLEKEESLLDEDRQELLEQASGECYEVAILEGYRRISKGKLDVASLVRFLSNLEKPRTSVHLYFQHEECAKDITPDRLTTKEAVVLGNRPNSSNITGTEFESLLPEQEEPSQSLLSVDIPEQPQSRPKQLRREQEQFDPFILQKQTLASSKLIAKNKEILELKRTINLLQDELLELRRQNLRLSDTVAQLSAQSKENDEADTNNMDIVKKRRRVDDGSDSTRKSVLVQSKGRMAEESRIRSESLLSKYRRSMMELERSHAQLEDELHMLKYAGVKL